MKKTNPLGDKLWAARQTLSVNLFRAMSSVLKDESNRPIALQKRTGIGKSVINRLLRPKSDKDPYPTLETLVKLAHGLGISVFELVIDSHDMRHLAATPKREQDDNSRGSEELHGDRN